MLRFIVYLVSVLKLLALGRWYPPAHVRDVSSADFEMLKEVVLDHAERLRAAEKQVESTRMQVYRTRTIKADEEEGKALIKPAVAAKSAADLLASLQSGDEVPTGIL